MNIERNLAIVNNGYQPRRPHILLVDECSLRCYINRGHFGGFPCQVSEAYGGLQALEFLGLVGNMGLVENGFQRPAVDMIVTVFEMSEISGFQLLRIIKNSPINHLPVVVTVPDENQIRIALCLRGGARACVVEPLRSEYVGEILALLPNGPDR